MTLTLDHATEELLRQELAIGRFREPSALIAHALDLVKTERSDLSTRRVQMMAQIEESLAQLDGGAFVTEDEMRARMAAHRPVKASPTA